MEPEILDGNRFWCQTDTTGVHQGEFAGVDPSGNAQKIFDGLREMLNEMLGESLEHVTASGRGARDNLWSVRRSGTSDPAWWPERLHGVLQARWRESAGFANTVTGRP